MGIAPFAEEITWPIEVQEYSGAFTNIAAKLRADAHDSPLEITITDIVIPVVLHSQCVSLGIRGNNCVESEISVDSDKYRPIIAHYCSIFVGK